VSGVVALEPLRDEDSDALFGWINDRELVLLNAPFEPVARPEHDDWFNSVSERDDVEIHGVRTVAEDRLIGSCQLNRIDREAGTCTLQIRIGDRSEWGRGRGTEAVGLLLERAFGDLGMREVRLDVFATNLRAIRAYEKAGFARTGIRPGGATIEGEAVDVIEMTAQGPGGKV
jgi:RimJ/RimL family protein N-acetyltransferase